MRIAITTVEIISCHIVDNYPILKLLRTVKPKILDNTLGQVTFILTSRKYA